MALLGRLIILVQDTSGNSSVGASVSVLRQGAQIKGTQAGPTYTVDDPGGILVGDVVFAASAPGTLRAVTAVTATTVTVGAPGLGNLNDDDRLVLSTSGNVTLYSDATGTDTLANPLTTDASGVATAWVPGGFYDADFSGGTPSLTRAFQYDIYVAGYKTISDIYNSGSAVAFQNDTLRTLGAGDKLFSWRNNTVEKASLGYDGTFTAGPGSFTTLTASSTTTTAGITNTGTITSSGNITVSGGGVTVTGNSSITGSLTGITGITRGAAYQSSIPTLTLNSATPTVTDNTVFAENNTVPTNITDFNVHNAGHQITIIINTTNTTFVNGATLKMAGGINFNPNGNDVISFVQWSGTWYEVGRSVN